METAALARSLFVKELNKEGLYEISEKSFSYSDIVAKRKSDGIVEYYEIKGALVTKDKYEEGKEKYFGAATLTEWNVAIKCPDRYFFVIVFIEKSTGNLLGYEKYSPQELLHYSTIPPFKVNMNVPYSRSKEKTESKHRLGTVSAENPNGLFERINALTDKYTEMDGSLLLPEEFLLDK